LKILRRMFTTIEAGLSARRFADYRFARTGL
jgi:hypothetical protein